MKHGVDFPALTVAYYCYDSEGNYLMHKRSVNCRDEHGKWDFGGGKVEFGDSALETLHKEIKEEFGVEAKNVEFLGYTDIIRKDNDSTTHWIGLHFKAFVDRAQVKNNEPHKFDEIGWFALDNLPSPLHSQILSDLEKFRDML